MTHRAYGMENHSRCPTPDDCVCACVACLMARARLIDKQRAAEAKANEPAKRVTVVGGDDAASSSTRL